jgi:hypothetical protein
VMEMKFECKVRKQVLHSAIVRGIEAKGELQLNF